MLLDGTDLSFDSQSAALGVPVGIRRCRRWGATDVVLFFRRDSHDFLVDVAM